MLRHPTQGSRGSRVPEMVPGQIRGILGFRYCAITGHVTGPFQNFLVRRCACALDIILRNPDPSGFVRISENKSQNERDRLVR